MKKIFILALTFMLLSVLPAFAANETEVHVTTCQNIADDLLVTIETVREDFDGATIDVGGKITYNLEGEGEGKYTANIALAGLDRAGETTVTVTPIYGGAEGEAIEKTVSIFKMAETVTKYTKSNAWLHNVAAGWSGANGDTTAYNLDEFGNQTTDTGAFLFKWKDQEPFKAGDTRVGLQCAAGSNTAEGMYYIDHDIYFIYGDEGKVEVPKGVRFFQYYRTKNSTTGTPVYTDGRKNVEEDIRTFIASDSGGKLADGTQLYTNTWYRIRIVIDKYSKYPDGSYKGGLSYYYAVADENGEFGDYKLIKHHENVYLEGICGWRYEFKAPDVKFSFAFKNFKFTYLKPETAWYLEDIQPGGDSVKLTFSEDMGKVAASSFKLFTKYNVDENGDVIYEEIPVSSVAAAGENEYVLTLPKSLLYGKAYEIRLANGFKSVGGSVAFGEPSSDDNGDGFWNFSELTTPKYPLNISYFEDEGTHAVVKFDNTDISGKYVAVCWYSEKGALADYSIEYLDSVVTVDDTVVFYRNNDKPYSKVKAYVFDFDTNAESDEYGKMNIYESK